MLTAFEVAEHLITSSIRRDDLISNSKLQCLLYYAQAWHLAIHDERLFTGDIEAWESGPVVPSIRGQFEKPERSSCQTRINADIMEHLQCIMERYGAMTADQLQRLTQTEPPWIIARGETAYR